MVSDTIVIYNTGLYTVFSVALRNKFINTIYRWMKTVTYNLMSGDCDRTQ